MKAARRYFALSFQRGSSSFSIALQTEIPQIIDSLNQWLIGIQSLGKRGSFVQITGQPQSYDDLPEGFIRLDGLPLDGFLMDSTLQEVDDTGNSLSFGRANIYSGEKITLGKDRILHPVLLPYRRAGSSRSYTLYIRSDRSESES